MKVIVYVEGPSDQKALQALLKPIIEAGRANRVGISFSPQGGKAAILEDVPRKAAEYLQQHPEDWIFVLPDLYPMAHEEGPSRHRSASELFSMVQGKFAVRAEKLELAEDTRRHFRAHCLKHDLEALLLASHEKLRERLKTKDALRDAWRRPVEQQNDKRPPKRVVEELFKKYRKQPGYVETTDAVWILERASVEVIEKECSECFAPFVRELRNIAHRGDPEASA